MKMFETFNYDIIIVLILISSVIMSLYFNLYRQGRRTLSLLFPFIILYFTFDVIYDNVINIDFIKNSITKITNIFQNKQITSALVIYILLYVILVLIVRLVYGLFKVPVQKRVLNKSTKTAKILSVLLGVINGYLLGMILMFALNPIISINYEKPITKTYLDTSNNVIQFSTLNIVQNVNTKKYFEYEETLGKLTGKVALNHYYEVLKIFNSFEELEEMIMDEYSNLSEESKLLIVDSNILASFHQNLSQIIKYENNKELIAKLKGFDKTIDKYIVYLDAYRNLSSFDFVSVTEYLINNYEELKSKSTKPMVIDGLEMKVKAFKDYYENKDIYLSLIPDYVAVDEVSNIIYFSKYLNENPLIIIDNYENQISNKDSSLMDLFSRYLNNKDIIDQLPKGLSLSIKLIIIENKFVNFIDIFSSNSLVKAFIQDSLTNKDSINYRLYAEYIFYVYLAKEVNINNFTVSEYQKLEANLEKIVNEKYITLDQAKIYLKNLVEDRFYGILTQEVLDEIKNLESEYTTSLNLNS